MILIKVGENMEKAKYTYISLFSSAGIGCYGFNQAGFQCIATNEVIARRLNIQKANNKCERDSGYICGDISKTDVKQNIVEEVNWWRKNRGVKDVTVVVATPPCQGMSVFNHKKNPKDIKRNSLVIESLKMVKQLHPLFFVFENVPAFMDTACMLNDTVTSIREAHHAILGNEYVFYDDVLNFKFYGSKSSRTRTLVIGVHRKLARFVSPAELFPDREEECLLRSVIGDLPALTKMGEISDTDIYHSFRPYPLYMLPWIETLAEGESAFDNKDDERRPYKFTKDGTRIANVNKTGDKYTRQYWDRIGPSVHTRNDQLASQNTIHPRDNRVFSIRELMLMMTIPQSFKWDRRDLEVLNSLSIKEKEKYLKQNETNIRQCIGEAVPTIIFSKIASNIAQFMGSSHLSDRQIHGIIKANDLDNPDNLLTFISESIAQPESEASSQSINNATLSRIAELANTSRDERAAYYTEKVTLTHIFEHLPYIDKDLITILEPSVGTGNFIPFLIKKYSYAKELIIDVIDIDNETLNIANRLWQGHLFPPNVKINTICEDFLDFNLENKHYDLIIGNPPYIRILASKKLKTYQEAFNDPLANNAAAFFVEKSCMYADYIAFILPKTIFCNSEYGEFREKIRKKRIETIVDFGEQGFSGINIETVFLVINARKRGGNVRVVSIPRGIRIVQKQSYICSPSLPSWVIYRDKTFDSILSNKRFDVFTAFRDRQITKSIKVKRSTVWVIKSKNIPRDGRKLIHIDSGQGDLRLNRNALKDFEVYRYIDRDDVFLVPNMTYYPRMVRKPLGVVANGSVAILIPKDGITVSDDDIAFIASEEFEAFYRIARNHATRTLNIDATSVYYFCIS